MKIFGSDMPPQHINANETTAACLRATHRQADLRIIKGLKKIGWKVGVG